MLLPLSRSYSSPPSLEEDLKAEYRRNFIRIAQSDFSSERSKATQANSR